MNKYCGILAVLALMVSAAGSAAGADSATVTVRNGSVNPDGAEIKPADADKALADKIEDVPNQKGVKFIEKTLNHPAATEFVPFQGTQKYADIWASTGSSNPVQAMSKDGASLAIGIDFSTPQNAAQFPLRAKGNLKYIPGPPRPPGPGGGSGSGKQQAPTGIHWAAVVDSLAVEITASKNAAKLNHPADSSVPEWGSAWVSADKVIANVQGNREKPEDYVTLTVKATGFAPIPDTAVSWDGDGVTDPKKPLERLFARNKAGKYVTAVKIAGVAKKSAVVWVVKAEFPRDAFANTGKPRSDWLMYTVFSGSGGALGLSKPGVGTGTVTPFFFLGKGKGALTGLTAAANAPPQRWLVHFTLKNNQWDVLGLALPNMPTSQPLGLQKNHCLLNAGSGNKAWGNGKGGPYVSDNDEVSFTVTENSAFADDDLFEFATVGTSGFHQGMELMANVLPPDAASHPDIKLYFTRAAGERFFFLNKGKWAIKDRGKPNAPSDPDQDPFWAQQWFGKQIYAGDAPGPDDDSNSGNDDEAVKKANFISSVDVIFNVPQPFVSATFDPLLYAREKCADDFKWHAILWVERSPANPLKFVTVDSKCELDVGHTVVGQTP